MEHVNAAIIIGDTGTQLDDHWLCLAQRSIMKRGETKPTIYTEEVSVAGEKPAHKRVIVKGRLKPHETDQGVRTYLDPFIIEKATKKQCGNQALLIGEFSRWMPRNLDPTKTAFGNQLLRVAGHTLRATLFENPNFRMMSAWENLLRVKDAGRPGSIIEVEGWLRNNKYVDNNGNDQTMLELIANRADVLFAAPNPFKALQNQMLAEDPSIADVPESEEVDGSEIPF